MGARLPQQSAACKRPSEQTAPEAPQREGGTVVCARLRDGRRAAELAARLAEGWHALPDASGGSQPGDHYALGVRERDPEEPPGAPRRCLGVVVGLAAGSWQLAANMAARGTGWVG